MEQNDEKYNVEVLLSTFKYFIILLPQDTKNLTHIHADDCAGDIPLLEFKQFCHRVWSEDHNFVTIDLTSIPTNGKSRQNFNRFYFANGII